MSSRRTLILIAAVLVGAVAAFALFTYVGGIEDRANDRAERVEVYKIAQDIPRGTYGDQAFEQGLIVKDQIQKAYRPANAIVDPGQVSNLVAISDLAANQVLVANQFVDQSVAFSGYSTRLQDNEVAISISVDQVRGVAGLLAPGDFVNVLVTQPANAASGGEGGPGSVFGQPARVLFQKVQILAVDRQVQVQPGETVSTDEGGTVDAANSGLITFAVPADAAQLIASVDAASYYLTLVPRDYQPEPLPPFDLNAPLPGEESGNLTPYGPEGRIDS